jgi:hypothetical protein
MNKIIVASMFFVNDMKGSTFFLTMTMFYQVPKQGHFLSFGRWVALSNKCDKGRQPPMVGPWGLVNCPVSFV